MIAGGFEGSKIQMSTCEVFEELKDLKWWLTALWGFIGQRDDGWKAEDEDKWDEAIDILMKTMKSSPGVTTMGNGDAMLKFVVNISISTK